MSTLSLPQRSWPQLPTGQPWQWRLAMLPAGWLHAASLAWPGHGAALWWLQPAPQPRITQKMIDAAVLHTLEHNSLPSATARAAEAVAATQKRRYEERLRSLRHRI